MVTDGLPWPDWGLPLRLVVCVCALRTLLAAAAKVFAPTQCSAAAWQLPWHLQAKLFSGIPNRMHVPDCSPPLVFHERREASEHLSMIWDMVGRKDRKGVRHTSGLLGYFLVPTGLLRHLSGRRLSGEGCRYLLRLSDSAGVTLPGSWCLGAGVSGVL